MQNIHFIKFQDLLDIEEEEDYEEEDDDDDEVIVVFFKIYDAIQYSGCHKYNTQGYIHEFDCTLYMIVVVSGSLQYWQMKN